MAHSSKASGNTAEHQTARLVALARQRILSPAVTPATASFTPLLQRWHAVAHQHAHATALVDTASGHQWSFADLLETSRQAARAARTAGPDHSPVACPQGQGAGFLLAVLAAWETGKIVCPLEPEVAAPGPSTWRGLTAAFPDTVLAKTTSGSTGTPRHVLFSAAQLAADARAIVTTMGLHPGQPNVGAISLAHSYGFSNLVLPLLLHGIPLVLAGSPLPEAVRSALHAATALASPGAAAALPGVPAMWQAWHAAGVLSPATVGLAISAGAPLPLALEAAVWTEAGVKIHNFLGASECGGLAYDRTRTPRHQTTLAGTPLEGVHLHTDARGQLVVHSPAVATTYWPPAPPEPPGLTTPALGPGFFRTGDLAEGRPDGWHLLGRAADCMNLAGRKVHPAEIETTLRRHPAVTEAVVFSIPSANPARGEEIVATLALDPAVATTTILKEIRSWLAPQLPAWQRPRHWQTAADLAPNARGKLPRAAWRARFLATTAPGPTATPAEKPHSQTPRP